MIYLFVPLALIIGFIIGKILTKKYILKSLSRGTGRMGIIRFNNGSSYSLCSGVIEIEELEVCDDLTKIIIHKVIPDRCSDVQSRYRFLQKWGANDWVSTKKINWYDDNTQRIRDSKIEEILK